MLYADLEPVSEQSLHVVEHYFIGVAYTYHSKVGRTAWSSSSSSGNFANSSCSCRVSRPGTPSPIDRPSMLITCEADASLDDCDAEALGELHHGLACDSR
mmetsp:Transcript_13650/g.31943  ORF Transcript_13650/g.31943 Transcript_13650/m.31943 type:complete len:100 (+) Transcript_13650:205-504(+)